MVLVRYWWERLRGGGLRCEIIGWFGVTHLAALITATMRASRSISALSARVSHASIPIVCDDDRD